jgi:endonuclease IV
MFTNARFPFTEEESLFFKIGSHILKDKTLVKSLYDLPENTVCQLYLGGNRTYTRVASVKDIIDTRKVVLQNSIRFYIHGSLLYNLCGCVDTIPDESYNTKLSNVIAGLTYELDVAVGCGCQGVVVHFGSCKDYLIGEERMVKNIKTCLDKKSAMTDVIATLLKITPEEVIKNRSMILENSAHEGTKLGHTVKQIQTIVEKIDDKRISVCIDTAHIFGAGECDLRVDSEIIKLFEKTKELPLKLIHLNDSKAKFGSKKDRHELLYFGEIWTKESLYLFLQLFKEVDKVIEV